MWPLTAQLTQQLPEGLPWWAWLIVSIVTAVLGSFLPKTYDFFLKKFKIRVASEADLLRAEGEVKQANLNREHAEQKDIVDEYRRVLRFQETRISKLEKKIEEQEQNIEDVREKERQCLIAQERLQADNQLLHARLGYCEDALTRHGITFGEGIKLPAQQGDCNNVPRSA